MTRASACCLLLGLAAPSSAQEPTGMIERSHPAHVWLARAHALGLVTVDPAVRIPLPVDTAGLPEPLRRRLAGAVPLATGRAVQVYVHGGLSADEGGVTPGGFSPDREWQPPEVRPSSFGTRLVLDADAAVAPFLDVTVRGRLDGDGVVVENGAARLRVARVHLWAGRLQRGYSPGIGGGLVLTRIDRLEGAALQLAQGVRVPVLGAIRGEVYAGRIGRNGFVDAPWLAGMRGHLSPHAAFDVGVTRAAVFGGMNGARVGLAQIAEVLVGGNLAGDHADDQIASVDARWRIAGLGTPLELYGEWAMHDIDAGVLIDMPAFTAGVRLPALLRGTGIALEHTQVAGSCCRNPPWYHHFELSDGWSSRGVHMGHPLGGHGRSWHMAISGAGTGARLLYDAGAAIMTRHHENVFAPTRLGRSTLVHASADAQLTALGAVRVRVHHERGRGWSETRGTVMAQWQLR